MIVLATQHGRRSGKPRNCWLCAQTIATGEPHVAQSCVDGCGKARKAYTVRAHEECQALLDLGDFIEEDDCATLVGDDAIGEALDSYGPTGARATIDRVADPVLRARLLARYAHTLEVTP